MEFNNKTYQIKIWNNEKLGNIIAFDTETTLVPFILTPDIVTFQAYAGTDTVYFVRKNDLEAFLNRHYDSTLVAHNAKFDMDVLIKAGVRREWIYDIYDRNKIHDTSLLYRLLHLAAIGQVPFKYNLQLLTKKYMNVEIEKDERRENFAQFINTDILEIPQDYLEYAAIDVIATFHVYFALLSLIRPYDKYKTLLSHDIQAKGDFALGHIYKNGIGFDLSQRDEWLAGVDKQLEQQESILATYGVVRGVKGYNDRVERVFKFLDIELPRTETGALSTKREDLEPYQGVPFVDAYLKFMELEKASSFVREISSERIHPKYNTILNTGRTSCSKPNFQQLPRVGGIREMFRASSGNTFLITDYSTLELATLSQVMYREYGHSVMRDQINEGADLHKFYASVMHGCDIKDVTKKMRQEAKAANFGFPGGLGTETFIQFSRGYGLEITQLEAQRMKDAWKSAFPETREYLNGEKGHVYTLTGRRRGNTTFCAEKNTPFQGLAADGAKLALYNLDKQGFKIVGFVHDEIICEVSKQKAEEALLEQEKIMVESMRSVVPDVKISVESQISEYYTK